MTKKESEETPGGYATGPDQPGRPVGPDDDASFHVEEWGDDQNAEAPEDVKPAPVAESKDVKKS